MYLLPRLSAFASCAFFTGKHTYLHSSEVLRVGVDSVLFTSECQCVLPKNKFSNIIIIPNLLSNFRSVHILNWS